MYMPRIQKYESGLQKGDTATNTIPFTGFQGPALQQQNLHRRTVHLQGNTPTKHYNSVHEEWGVGGRTLGYHVCKRAHGNRIQTPPQTALGTRAQTRHREAHPNNISPASLASHGSARFRYCKMGLAKTRLTDKPGYRRRQKNRTTLAEQTRGRIRWWKGSCLSPDAQSGTWLTVRGESRAGWAHRTEGP